MEELKETERNDNHKLILRTRSSLNDIDDVHQESTENND